ncbi:restriction endonuclease subunit S [Streptomyces sp. SID13031]|uniref:restriction endonuclease subunit S n=1 Tax=Streptomyces sp. SID13031 TaxID=2706046 RepID=UPI0013C89395|nr:restriction endonuclease subunit S [Streptomyces sp. SID13031]NEA34304.1 hypothetical protein [Streptomyces sp. SID13031]
MTEWPTLPLGELCDRSRGITYGIVKVGDFVAGGVPVIRGGDIRNNRIVFNDEKRVTQEVSDGFSRTILHGGELVINLIAEPGHSAIVPTEMAGFNVSRDVAVIALGDSVSHSFVNWYLKSPAAVEWLTARLRGSVTQKINLGVLREIPVPMPERSYQERIAATLGAMDDKITANRHFSATADSLISARYEGAHREVSEEFRQEKLSSAAEFINGRAFTKDATGTGRMVARIAELNSGPGSSTVYNDIEVPDKHLVRPGDLLFAWSGSLTIARWYRPEAIINQHIFKVVPKDDRPTWLVAELLRLKLDEFRAIAADKATTMGHIQRRHLDELVLTPSIAMAQKLDSQLGPIWDRALAAEQESLTLTALRDTLLPQLMSGKLRVRNAEKIVEDAV